MNSEMILPLHGVPRSAYNRTSLFGQVIAQAIPDPAKRPLDLERLGAEVALHFPNVEDPVFLEAAKLGSFTHCRREVMQQAGLILPTMRCRVWAAVVLALWIEEEDAARHIRASMVRDLRHRVTTL